MSIGIGLTSYNRPESVKECIQNISKYTESPFTLYIAEDTDLERKGVAYRKNECLRALKDCDHIFLFDDDCFPIKSGWEQFFINSKYNHLLYLNASHGYKRTVNQDCNVYHNCGGVFMYITKEVVKLVGAFDEQFELYGFEHADYSQRIHKAGFIVEPYMCLKGTNEFIFAHDYSTKGHKSSITNEEKMLHVKNNWDKFFNNKNKSLYLPL